MIDHQSESQRFCIHQSGAEAVLAYQLNEHRIHFTHTYVPDSMRGQGVAEKLVRTGLNWAREQGYEITTSCWYVDKFMRKEADE